MEARSGYLLRQATGAVFKHRRLVMLLFLLVLVPSNLGNLLKAPTYSASAKILIGKARVYPEVSPMDRKEEVSSLPNDSLVNSEMQVLRSRELLRRLHFDLAAAMAGDGETDPDVPSMQSLRDSLRVVRKADSNVVEVSYRSTSEENAVLVVNSLVRLYVDYSIELHSSRGAAEFFERELQMARVSLGVMDKELQDFDKEHGLTAVATQKDALIRQQAQVEADLRRTEASIAETGTRIVALEAELEYVPESGTSEVDMVPNPLVGFLRQNLSRLKIERERLLQLYTPEHRLLMDVDREIAALAAQVEIQEQTIVGRKKITASSIRRRIEESLLDSQAQLGALESRRALLAEKLGSYGVRISTMHEQHYEVMRMRRDRQEKKDTYRGLLQKSDQLRVSSAMDKAGISGVSIIEAAGLPLPKVPDFKVVTMVLSLFAALLISVGSAVAMELLTPVMNSAADVRYNLGVPVIAELSEDEYGESGASGTGARKS